MNHVDHNQQQPTQDNLSSIDEELSKQEVFLQHLKKVYGYRQRRCKSTGKLKNKPIIKDPELVIQGMESDQHKYAKVERDSTRIQNMNQLNDSGDKSIELITTSLSQEEQQNLSTNENDNRGYISQRNKYQTTKNSPTSTARSSMNYIDILQIEREKVKESCYAENSIRKRINQLRQHEDSLRRLRQDSKTKTYDIYSTKRRIQKEDQLKQEQLEYQSNLITIKNENVQQIKESLDNNIRQSKQSLKEKQFIRGMEVRQKSKADEERRQQELERLNSTQRERAQKVKEQLNQSQKAIEKFKEQKKLNYQQSYEQKLAIQKYLLNQQQKEMMQLQKNESQLLKRLSSSKIITLQQNKILQHSYYHHVAQFSEQYPDIRKEYEDKNHIYNPNPSRSPSNERIPKSSNSIQEKYENNDSLSRLRNSINSQKLSTKQTYQGSSNRNISPAQIYKNSFTSMQPSPKRSNSMTINSSQLGSIKRSSQKILQMY